MIKKVDSYSVIIPVYNECGNLHPLYKRVCKAMSALTDSFEIIFIDDGSLDRSYEVLKDIASIDGRVKAISFRRNYGQHPAVIAGMSEAAGDFIITMDADMEEPPEETRKLVEKMKYGYDMVAGRRVARKHNIVRRTGSFFANIVIFILTRFRMKDYGCMLRVYKKDLAKELVRHYRRQRLFIPVLTSKITKNIAEVDILHGSRFTGQPKYSYLRLTRGFCSIALRFYPKLSNLLQDIGILKKDSELYTIKEISGKGSEIK